MADAITKRDVAREGGKMWALESQSEPFTLAYSRSQAADECRPRQHNGLQAGGSGGVASNLSGTAPRLSRARKTRLGREKDRKALNK